MNRTIGADAARRLGAAALISTAALLGACGTPPPDGTTTTTIDDNACQIERQTIETALEASLVSDGAYPSSIAELIDEGWIAPKHISLAWTYQSDGVTYTLTGSC